MTARRGDVWLADLGTPVGREKAGLRPVVVVSADGLNSGPAGVVIIVPVTTTRRGLPSHIEVPEDDSGLDHASYAKAEDVKSISVERLITRTGHVGPDVTFGLARVLRYLLDL